MLISHSVSFFTQIQVSDLFTAAVSDGLTLQRLVGPVCPGRAKSVNINKCIGLEILINYANSKKCQVDQIRLTKLAKLLNFLH